MKNAKNGLVRSGARPVAAETPQKPPIFHSLARGSEVGQNGNITNQKDKGI